LATTSLHGLSESEVLARRKRGEGNHVRLPTSRSYTDILRQNVVRFINIILFIVGALLLWQGRVSDAISSVGLVFLNIIIAVFQEARAKRKLDQIALLARPKVTVMREGHTKTVDPSELVLGDILVATLGDQIVVDGEVVGEGTMDVDESLLTGESDLVTKKEGDKVLSGSFCVSGSAHYVAQKVGKESFANQLTASARSFRVVKTPLQKDIDLIIRLLTGMAALLALVLFISILLYPMPAMRSIQLAAVITGFVPIGLSFLVVISYAMGAVRIASRGALIQQSNSVESLSNVNVLCMDKTGTLTANRIRFHDLYPNGIEKHTFKRLLGDFAASTSAGNRTTEAIAAALSGEAHPLVDEVAFSSARKWSAISVDCDGMHGVYALGALEMLQLYLASAADLSAKAAEWAKGGLRVVLFAHAPDVVRLHDSLDQPRLPERLISLGLVSFSDELRQEAESTLAGFAKAGVRLKIISGDNPDTVAALAKQAGLDGDLKVISGVELENMDAAEFERAADELTIFGRITPQQKEKLVEALRKRGCYVAMIGDGVNDVLSLKKSQLGIAMQSGSAATRSVADMVLLNDSFAALPPAFLEGQRIINGMKDVLRLFLTRALFNALLIIACSILKVGFPYTPSQITLLTLLTVGIPTLALAAWARPAVPSQGLIRSVLHFVLSASVSIFMFGMVVYLIAYVNTYNEALASHPTPQVIAAFKASTGINYDLPNADAYAFELAGAVARTAVTAFTTLTGLLLIVFVAPPVSFFVGGNEFSGDWRPTILAGILLVVFVVIVVVPPLRDFFDMYPLGIKDYLLMSAGVLVWGVVQRFLWRWSWLQRF
jgi:cation-transporting ATPase E